MSPMKYWEIVAEKLNAAGWTWGYCSAVTRDGWRWVVDVQIYKEASETKLGRLSLLLNCATRSDSPSSLLRPFDLLH